jgi:hypothetical protein
MTVPALAGADGPYQPLTLGRLRLRSPTPSMEVPGDGGRGRRSARSAAEQS